MDELLLDTTYLLPVFGLSVDLRQFESRFPQLLHAYSVIYNPVSLVEAKWITLKLIRRHAPNRDSLLQAYRKGLAVLTTDGRLKQTAMTNARIEETADRLLLKGGLKDYFDRVIYATATDRNCLLLTEDEEIHQLAPPGGSSKLKGIVRWDEIQT